MWFGRVPAVRFGSYFMRMHKIWFRKIFIPASRLYDLFKTPRAPEANQCRGHLDPHIWYSNDFPWSQDVKFDLGLGWPSSEIAFLNFFISKSETTNFKISNDSEMYNFFLTKKRILTTMIFESRVVMHIARLKQNDVRPEGLCFYGCQNRAGKCILPTIFHPAGQYECTRPKSLGYFRCPLGTASRAGSGWKFSSPRAFGLTKMPGPRANGPSGQPNFSGWNSGQPEIAARKIGLTNRAKFWANSMQKSDIFWGKFPGKFWALAAAEMRPNSGQKSGKTGTNF